MKKETFIKILKEKSVSFTESDLQQLIDDELEKDVEEMDTDLIDSCLDALAQLKTEQAEKAQSQQRRRIKLSKVLLVAAIIIIIISIAIPACAKFLYIDVAENNVKYYGDHFLVDMSNKKISENSVIETLKENGMERIYLPAELANSYDEVIVSNQDDFTKSFVINAKINNVDCQIGIGVYSDGYNTSNGQAIIPDNFEKVVQIKNGDIDILIFSNNEYSYIYYIDNNYEYNMSLTNGDFNDAVMIAGTIEELK